MSKELVNPPPNIDTFGHCVLCHRNLLMHQVIDGKLTQRFHPDYAEEQYLLDDGTKMRVAICKSCQVTLDGTEHEQIMECVVNGWKAEVETYSHWEQEKKDNYIRQYSKLKILTNTKDIAETKLRKIYEKYVDDRKKHK